MNSQNQDSPSILRDNGDDDQGVLNPICPQLRSTLDCLERRVGEGQEEGHGA